MTDNDRQKNDIVKKEEEKTWYRHNDIMIKDMDKLSTKKTNNNTCKKQK